MSGTRKRTAKMLRGLGLLAFVVLACFLWDRNEQAYDEEQTVHMTYDLIRTYHFTGDPGAVSCPYVGCKRTKSFHRFTSKCSPHISIVDLKPFDSRQEAVEARYNACILCGP